MQGLGRVLATLWISVFAGKLCTRHRVTKSSTSTAGASPSHVERPLRLACAQPTTAAAADPGVLTAASNVESPLGVSLLEDSTPADTEESNLSDDAGVGWLGGYGGALAWLPNVGILLWSALYSLPAKRIWVRVRAKRRCTTGKTATATSTTEDLQPSSTERVRLNAAEEKQEVLANELQQQLDLQENVKARYEQVSEELLGLRQDVPMLGHIIRVQEEKKRQLEELEDPACSQKRRLREELRSCRAEVARLTANVCQVKGNLLVRQAAVEKECLVTRELEARCAGMKLMARRSRKECHSCAENLAINRPETAISLPAPSVGVVAPARMWVPRIRAFETAMRREL